MWIWIVVWMVRSEINTFGGNVSPNLTTYICDVKVGILLFKKGEGRNVNTEFPLERKLMEGTREGDNWAKQSKASISVYKDASRDTSRNETRTATNRNELKRTETKNATRNLLELKRKQP